MTTEMVGEHVSSKKVGCCNRVITYRLQQQPENCCDVTICNQEGICTKAELKKQEFIIEYPKEPCKEGN